YLPGLNVSLVAVDEAHCISQWGYDFRPSYLRIAALREELRNVPILALTASATPLVQEDICDKLLFTKPAIFRQTFERPNLSYSLFEADSKINKIVDILQKVPGSSIIYCKSRKRTKNISDQLNMHGIQADYYHAGLNQEERSRKQEAWIKNSCRVIVCTNAFGMGIDKPDVRTVIHADVPDCIENYYQEAGRAGRDGQKAYAVLLHNEQEIEELQLLPDIRFPSLANIRLVYQSLVNYLQIPTGSGEGVYYDFDLTEFSQRFHLDAWLVTYAIKALEQDGWLAFNEQVFIPSKVQFITNKEWLYTFEETNPELEPLIQTLLRTYEGIYDVTVGIQEKNLAYLLYRDIEEVKKQLRILDANAIIEYFPQKDSPQIYFMHRRMRAEELRIDWVQYEKRKQQTVARIAAITSYVRDTQQCRSQYIAEYFGDTATKACGICDNCRNNKQSETLSAAEFTQIHERIIAIIGHQQITINELLQQLQDIRKEKAWQVINFLQAQNKISVNEMGLITISG
ncbi:MAG: RecQ family ATP-dependent DNA helicase, partial [Chitinophagaceae bacterium]